MTGAPQLLVEAASGCSESMQFVDALILPTFRSTLTDCRPFGAMEIIGSLFHCTLSLGALSANGTP